MKRMVRRTLIVCAIAAAIVVSACRGTQNRAEAPGRPNVLVICADDHAAAAQQIAAELLG